LCFAATKNEKGTPWACHYKNGTNAIAGILSVKARACPPNTINFGYILTE
jgi:hypothetical protein